MINDQFRLYEKSKWLQLAYNLLFILTWYLANDGLAFWDDFSYLNFAHQVNEGTFQINGNHFTSRIALIYPVAYAIDALGINAHTMVVFTLLCALLILNFLFYLGRQGNIWIALLGGFMLICDYHTIFFATHLFPELPMMLYVLLAIGAYDLVNRRVADHRVLGLITSLAIFVAFLTKTTIFLLIPLFVYLFWNDWVRRKRHKSYWLITVASLMFFVVLNFLFYYETTGDFFYRLNNISSNHEATVKTFFDKSFTDVLKRLTYLPLFGFMRGGFFIPLLFALPALLSIKKKSWRLDDQKMLWPIAIVFILGAWWFMSTNWKYYSPMPLDTRHIAFLIPLMIIAGVDYWSETALFKKLMNQKLGWALSLLLLLIPIYRIVISDKRNFDELEEVFSEELLSYEGTSTVFTDGLISYGYPYFYRFVDNNLQYEWFSETKRTMQKGDMILVNPAYLNERYNDAEHLANLKQEAEKTGTLDCRLLGAIELCVLK